MKLLSLSLTCVSVVLLAGTSEAAISMYASRPLFDASVGGQTLIDFDAQNPYGDGGYEYYGSNLTLGPVSFTQADARVFVIGKDVYSTAGLTSSYLNNNAGPQNVVINFGGGGIYSLGMDIGQLYSFTGPAGSLSLNLSSGDVINVTGLQQLENSSNTLQFVGFTSDIAITSMTIVDPSGGTAIDDFAYSSEINAAVPEPMSLLVWGGLGTLGVLWSIRKR